MQYKIHCPAVLQNSFPKFLSLFSHYVGAKTTLEPNQFFNIVDTQNFIRFSTYGAKITELETIQNMGLISEVSIGVMMGMERILSGQSPKQAGDPIHRIPYVDFLLDAIVNGVEVEKNIKIPRCSISPKGVIALSHDVDHLTLRKTIMLSRYKFWLKKKIFISPLFLIKAGLNLLPWVDFTNNFRKYHKIEDKLPSTYFFLDTTLKNTPRGTISQIYATNNEIGIHGNFGTHDDLDALNSQIADMENELKPIKGIRYHFLNFNPDLTWDLISKADIKYDASLGFSDDWGYRTGTNRPYSISGVVEIPMIFMDTYLKEISDKNPCKYWEKNIATMMNITRETRGILTINWHQSALNFPLGNYYQKIINEGKKNDFVFLTHYQVYRRFKAQKNYLTSKTGVQIIKDKILWDKEFENLFFPKLRTLQTKAQ
ncbi:hypothetical protein LCGC14_0303280 [marine sediment metagenome]|uniref:NodB homology domain-containing protein n=1 Tax=marine sediment metagenome TaxID=412755 RepID=A0A0F9U6V8_9ZZZZ